MCDVGFELGELTTSPPSPYCRQQAGRCGRENTPCSARRAEESPESLENYVVAVDGSHSRGEVRQRFRAGGKVGDGRC